MSKNVQAMLKEVSEKALASAKARLKTDRTEGPAKGTSWEEIPANVRESMIKDSCSSMIMTLIRTLSTAEANKNAKAVDKALKIYNEIHSL